MAAWNKTLLGDEKLDIAVMVEGCENFSWDYQTYIDNVYIVIELTMTSPSGWCSLLSGRLS